MYETGCFTKNGFYATTSSCASNTSSPDSLKHQRLLITATPSPTTVSQHFFPPQQYLFDPHRFHLNHNNNNNNNNNSINNGTNSNLNGTSDRHTSTALTQDPLSLWLAAQSSGQTAPVPTTSSTFRMEE